MARHAEEVKCTGCGKRYVVKYTSGMYPFKDKESVKCPNCGEVIFERNITGDVEDVTESIEC